MITTTPDTFGPRTLQYKVLSNNNSKADNLGCLPYSKDFAAWEKYFSDKAGARSLLPWDTDYILTQDEVHAITASVQQFQIGEYARGRTFMALAYRYAEKSGDSAYPRALKLFIREEQEHSAILGLFLDVSGLLRLKQHWVDETFRSLRKFAGLELMIRVLVTAEIIACPYYKALRSATGSPLLQAICRKILNDEEFHIYFQAQAVSKVNGSKFFRSIFNLPHLLFLYVTCVVVWHQHKPVFKRAGMKFLTFVREAKRQFEVFRRTLRL